MRHILVFNVPFLRLSITISNFRVLRPTRKETITKFGRSNSQPSLLEPGWGILVRGYMQQTGYFCKTVVEQKTVSYLSDKTIVFPDCSS